ncbi:MAG: SWIB/MDM2 domain-containing protein [Simkaniaceae bacterium]|nr:SWIB/MDM2 domain-containing protein [Chlamydiia bacterium]
MAKKTNTSFMKPMTISSELKEVIGAGPMPRTQVTKKLWDYIKKNKRQDPENKRNIIPDDKLAKVFGSKKAINMFEMTKKVNQHLS